MVSKHMGLVIASDRVILCADTVALTFEMYENFSLYLIRDVDVMCRLCLCRNSVKDVMLKMQCTSSMERNSVETGMFVFIISYCLVLVKETVAVTAMYVTFSVVNLLC